MRHYLKSRFPAANINHLPNMVSYDTLFLDMPTMDDGIPGYGGCTMMQIFYAKPSQLVYGVPLSDKRNIPDAVKDFIHKFGAPTAFLSNSAAKNKSGDIEDLDHHYNIAAIIIMSLGTKIKTGLKIKLEILRIWLITSWTLWAPLLVAG